MTEADIRKELLPLLEYYPERDQSIISDRVVQCVLMRQKAIKKIEQNSKAKFYVF